MKKLSCMIFELRFFMMRDARRASCAAAMLRAFDFAYIAARVVFVGVKEIEQRVSQEKDVSRANGEKSVLLVDFFNLTIEVVHIILLSAGHCNH